MPAAETQKKNQKAMNLMAIRLNESDFFVESSDGKIAYRVTTSNGAKSCTCSDFVSKIQKNPEFVCKHILAATSGNGNLMIAGAVETNSKPRLDERFLMTIQGKDFVIYAGLLDLAHQKGLQSIEVEVVQFPTKENGFEAICKAVIESRHGDSFVEFGDANPKNTNVKM